MQYMLHTIAINVYNYANEQNGGMHRLADKMLEIKLAMARSQPIQLIRNCSAVQLAVMHV